MYISMWLKFCVYRLRSTPSTSNVPPSVELMDMSGTPHTLLVNILASEATWQTPTLLLASKTEDGGKALFSQVSIIYSYSKIVELGLHLNANDTCGSEIRQTVWYICTLFSICRSMNWPYINILNANFLWNTNSQWMFVAQLNAVCLASVTRLH